MNGEKPNEYSRNLAQVRRPNLANPPAWVQVEVRPHTGTLSDYEASFSLAYQADTILSIGCKVQFSTCSICGWNNHDTNAPCKHADEQHHAEGG